MPSLKVKMFGEFSIQLEDVVWQWPEHCKTRELFSYLVIHPKTRHRREQVAELLWGNSSAATAKKNLRQALWQLQHKFGAYQSGPAPLLLATDAEWLALHPSLDLWADVASFEQACECLRATSELDHARAQSLQRAVELYQGDLLEGCYQDWCLYERERLQNLYLTMLGKLIGYCEKHGHYEAGIEYGERLLKFDVAEERAHQQLMRLRFLAGDRTGALRQFERCAKALQDEFGVEPERRTCELYAEIRADRVKAPSSLPTPTETGDSGSQPSNADLLSQLKEFQTTLAELQQQAQRWVRVIERLGVEQSES